MSLGLLSANFLKHSLFLYPPILLQCECNIQQYASSRGLGLTLKKIGDLKSGPFDSEG